MIISKESYRHTRRDDWYPKKIYLHFDGPAKRSVAERIVTDPASVAAHAFLPLMTFDRRERRFKRQKNKPPEVKIKIRRLAYPSNMDACIFSYYAHSLTAPYEQLIKTLGIDKCVIGYRRVGSNIDLALAAFTEIGHRGNCVAFAFDVSGFFDNIDHEALRRNWCRVLGMPSLPQGHDKVFQNLTRFSTIDRQACLSRLGYHPKSRDRQIANRPLCNIKDFRQIVKGRDGHSPSLVIPWIKDYRIPQGTPLSAMAANIAMIDFDIRMNEDIKSLDGSYRRYSDDILIIVPTLARDSVSTLLETNLKHCTRRLRVNSKKTDIVEFVPGKLAGTDIRQGLQYLGFLYDGKNTLIRPGTISKFYRRVHRIVRAAKRQQMKASVGQIPGRNTLHTKSVLAAMTHLGTKNFVTSYSARAKKAFGKRPIKRQLARHIFIIKRIIS